MTYWQAPVADNAANPAPLWIPRNDLVNLDTTNADVSHVECINPNGSQRYLLDVAQTIAPDANGYPMLLEYWLPFAPKATANIQLIFETQAPAFHFYSPSIAPYAIGVVPPISQSPSVANPAWANYARVWRNGHVSWNGSPHGNFSMVLQLPPNQLPLGCFTKLLIDNADNGGPNHMWVIAE